MLHKVKKSSIISNGKRKLHDFLWEFRARLYQSSLRIAGNKDSSKAFLRRSRLGYEKEEQPPYKITCTSFHLLCYGGVWIYSSSKQLIFDPVWKWGEDGGEAGERTAFQ